MAITTITCPSCGGRRGSYYWRANPDPRTRASMPQTQDWKDCGRCHGLGHVDVPDTRR